MSDETITVEVLGLPELMSKLEDLATNEAKKIVRAGVGAGATAIVKGMTETGSMAGGEVGELLSQTSSWKKSTRSSRGDDLSATATVKPKGSLPHLPSPTCGRLVPYPASPSSKFSPTAQEKLPGGRAGKIPFTVSRKCMNTQSLTVADRRHLSLPESCLFAPTELQIASSISQTDFSRLGKALASVDQASDLWACDYALAGQKRWGDVGLKLAAAATRLNVSYMKVNARIAERFEPARRFPNMTREHYRGLCCFPVEFTDKWLPTVVEKGFSAKTLRALAVEAFGSDPKAGYSKNKKRSVSLPETLFARLKECSPIPKVAVFIEQILLDFVSNATPEQKEHIVVALNALPRANFRARERRKEKKPKATKPRPAPEPKIQEPADVRYQLKKFEESQRRPYAERREEQIADGAKPVPVKDRKSKLRLQWSPCTPDAFVDSESGPVQFSVKAKGPTRFKIEADAVAAEAEFAKERGHRERVAFCDVCKSFHVVHVYFSEVRRVT
jgi:hypothetical protein